MRYQDIYPSPPLLESGTRVRPQARRLLTLEYFEAEPNHMPEQVFSQHHVLLNLRVDDHRVEHVLEGRRREFVFKENEVIVTPAGLRSGWRWHARSRVIVVTLDPMELERFARNELGIDLTPAQLREQSHFGDAELCAAALLLKDALESTDVGSDVMFESLARVFLVKLLRRYGQLSEEGLEFDANFTAEHYKRVLDFVAARFDRSLSVEELAKEAGLSPSHFSRLFKRATGRTPHQFLVRYRLERAVAMMEKPDASLSQIALSCGFADQAHFSRAFKLAYDQTPTRFRAGLIGS